jgi:hypothetical protein
VSTRPAVRSPTAACLIACRGADLKLADPSLWPALMEGMEACAHCEAQLWLVKAASAEGGGGGGGGGG